MLIAKCHCVKSALTGAPDECGDIGVIREGPDACFVALVDALGHGVAAAEVAALAEAFLAANPARELDALMNGLHDHLKGSRGAVAFLARLDLSTGELRYCGVGNITAKIFGADDPVRLISRDGIVGYMMSTPREGSHALGPGDILMLCSDGVRDHFELFDHPGLLRGQARDIAENVLQALSKGDDDASCLVMRVSR
ncbi:hypothetical protein JCM15519_30320 [Fundidesulfovibrio butyratiphilus]